eukprot:1834368-Amphidinium_carterae.1
MGLVGGGCGAGARMDSSICTRGASNLSQWGTDGTTNIRKVPIRLRDRWEPDTNFQRSWCASAGVEAAKCMNLLQASRSRAT